MRDFEHYFTDPSYAQAYGFNSKGLIYLENERDCAFWEEVLEATNPNQYDIKRSIAENNKSRGKRSLEKLYSTLNPNVLVAIDADFDYLCPKNTDYSEYISGDYILHTFSYSRESVMCNVESINDTIKKIRLYEKSNFNISDIIKTYSIICYKALPKFLFLFNLRNENVNESSFHDDLTISPSKELPLFTSDFEFNLAIFKQLEEKVEARLNRHNEIIESENLSAEFDLYLEHLLTLGFNENNAYRYISGHLIYENLILPILKAIKSTLLRIEIEKVKELHKGNSEAIKANISGVHNHFSEKCSYVTLLENCEKIKSDEIYQKILNKAKGINRQSAG